LKRVHGNAGNEECQANESSNQNRLRPVFRKGEHLEEFFLSMQEVDNTVDFSQKPASNDSFGNRSERKSKREEMFFNMLERSID